MHPKITPVYSRTLNWFRGWRTNRKLVIIESDDWGAIRTASGRAYSELQRKGYDMKASCYNLDALETNDDLELLFELLMQYKDINGRHPCITANMVMANPDFETVAKNNFKTYHFQSVSETISGYPDSDCVEKLWLEGLHNEVFIPQFHCREHLRYWEWMTDLVNAESEAVETFRLKMCGLPKASSKRNVSYFSPPYMVDSVLTKKGTSIGELINPGIDLFEEIFGFKPASGVAPNVAWTSTVEKVWRENGLKYVQGGWSQVVDDGNRRIYLPRYLGMQSNDLTHLVRNVTFEPAKNKKRFGVDECLLGVESAFKRGAPAIICSHRVNYIGRICKANRDKGLTDLKILLYSIIKKWPDVEFISSPELGDYMNNNGERQDLSSAIRVD